MDYSSTTVIELVAEDYSFTTVIKLVAEDYSSTASGPPSLTREGLYHVALSRETNDTFDAGGDSKRSQNGLKIGVIIP